MNLVKIWSELADGDIPIQTTRALCIPIHHVQMSIFSVSVRKKVFCYILRSTACFLCQRVSFYCPTFEIGSCSLHCSGANLTNNLHVSVPFLQLLQVHCCKPEYSDSLMVNRAQAFVWEEMSRRCRLPCLASVTGVDPPRWSPSTPTWTEIRTRILTAGFKKKTLGLSLLNMCTDLISSAMQKSPQYTLGFSHLLPSPCQVCIPSKEIMWLQCVQVTVEGFKQWQWHLTLII